MNLSEEIKTRLQNLEPSSLEIIDESAMHAGHAGYGGGAHFKLNLTSSHFSNKSQIMRHRLIYQILADLIPKKIHAISITARATDDPN